MIKPAAPIRPLCGNCGHGVSGKPGQGCIVNAQAYTPPTPQVASAIPKQAQVSVSLCDGNRHAPLQILQRNILYSRYIGQPYQKGISAVSKSDIFNGGGQGNQTEPWLKVSLWMPFVIQSRCPPMQSNALGLNLVSTLNSMTIDHCHPIFSVGDTEVEMEAQAESEFISMYVCMIID
jgi:hypothetical protein